VLVDWFPCFFSLQDKGFVAAVLEHWLGSREEKAASLDEAG
jgi:hypothetical protein